MTAVILGFIAAVIAFATVGYYGFNISFEEPLPPPRVRLWLCLLL